MLHRLAVSYLAALLLWKADDTCAEQAYPECTFESCPQCLLDIQATTENLSITGPDTLTYSSPLRIGRPMAYWDSLSLVGQAVGILAKEKLGFNVEYVHCDDETICTLATCSCSGYIDNRCDPVRTQGEAERALREGSKAFPDPLADVFLYAEGYQDVFNRELFESTNTSFDDKAAVYVGATGYYSFDGIYCFQELYDEAWETCFADTDSIRAFSRPEVRALTDAPRTLIEDGVEAEYRGCTGTANSVIESSMKYHRDANWTCNEQFWWLNPACAEYGDQWVTECVVILEDDWGYTKPELYDYLPTSDVPIAKLMVGYDPWWELLYYKAYNVLFTWWSPDATLGNQAPRRVSMPFGSDFSATMALKISYEPAFQSDDRLARFLSALTIDETYMLDWMDATSLAFSEGHDPQGGNATDTFYQKLACDWLRSNELWADWIASANRCSSGEYFDDTSSSCLGCPPGTAGATSLDGDLYCKVCAAGSYTNLYGMTVCLDCAKGSYLEASGETVCELCPTGSFSNTTAQTACTVCEQGTLQSRTTGSLGSSSGADCKCGEGSYEGKGTSECLACPEGMTCAFGSSFEAFANWTVDESSARIPMVMTGYFTMKSDPVFVYLCDSSAGTAHCPGGGPQTCAHGRVGLVCAQCPSGYAPTQDNTCTACDSLRTYAGVLLLVLLVVAVVAAITVMSKDTISQTRFSLSCAASLGLLITSLQSLGVFDQISVEWVQPVKALVSFGRFCSGNLDILRTSCFLGSDPVVTFSSRLLLAPAMLPLIGLGTYLRLGSSLGLGPELANVVGSCCSVVFISVVVTCTLPFVCYAHPSGAWSMRSSPSVLCFEGDQFLVMSGLGILLFVLIPLPFTAVAVYGSCTYPQLIQRKRANSALQALRFLFVKYTPRCYFYTPILLTRNLSLSFVPAIFSQAASQIICLCLLFTLFTCLQVRLQPWRSQTVNLADTALSVLLQTVLMSGALVSGVSARQDTFFVVNAITLLGFALVIFGLMVWNFHISSFGRHRQFSRFICHHKASAAAQARLLKIHLTSKYKTVFIDSDDLNDLDSLFDTVKTQVATLVVYLTRDTLRRPWCAGEITTAFRTARVKVLVVRTPSFVTPTAEDLEDLEYYVDETGCRLNQYGIFWDRVGEAFQKLLDPEQTPCIRLARPARLLPHYSSLSAAISKGASCELFSTETGVLEELSGDLGQVLLSADPSKDEAAAAAGILALKLREQLFLRDGSQTPVTSLVELGLGDLRRLARCVHHARAVIVMLSEHSLTNLPQLCVLIEATQQRQVRKTMRPGPSLQSGEPGGYCAKGEEAQGVVPLMLPGFRFPADDFYRHVLPGMIKEKPEEVRRRIRSFFNLIVLPFSIHLSDATLNSEVAKVLGRIPASFARSGELKGRTSQPLIHKLSSLSSGEGAGRSSSSANANVNRTRSSNCSSCNAGSSHNNNGQLVCSSCSWSSSLSGPQAQQPKAPTTKDNKRSVQFFREVGYRTSSSSSSSSSSSVGGGGGREEDEDTSDEGEDCASI